jgi:hypothetical protein
MNEIQENLVGKAGVDEPESGHGGRPSGSKNVGRFVLRIVLLFAGLFLLMMLGLMLISSLSLEGIQSFQEGLQWFNQGFAFVRVCLVGLLIIYWRLIRDSVAEIASDLELQHRAIPPTVLTILDRADAVARSSRMTAPGATQKEDRIQ